MTWPRFEFGASSPLLVRRERVAMPIDRPIRLLFASDLHLGNRWSPRVVDEVIRHTRIERPDALILGGDLADSPAGLASLRRLLANLRDVTNTAAILGNHDRRWGDRGAVVRRELANAGVAMLDERPLRVGGATLVANFAHSDDAGRVVHVVHDPADADPRARVALAGHLHGGQCVLWNRGVQQWPGWLINRDTILRRDAGDHTLIVSRGAADTLPLRFNCPREIIAVELDPLA